MSESDAGIGTAVKRLLTVPELAAQLQVPTTTIYTWRHRRAGPRSVKVGRHVRYRQEDVDAWLDSAAGDVAP